MKELTPDQKKELIELEGKITVCHQKLKELEEALKDEKAYWIKLVQKSDQMRKRFGLIS